MLSKTSGYANNFDEAKYISFIVKGDELLKKTIESSIKLVIESKKIGSEPVYYKKHLKTKIKSHKDKIETNFHDNGTPKESSHYIFTSVILTDSLFQMDKNFYPQMFLKEVKYIVK